MDEDQMLMEWLKSGDTDALGQLIGRWRSRAESFAVGILQDPQSAEEAVMEAFARIYATRSRYEPKCAFGTWFFTIVRRICIDRIRKEGNRPVPISELPETGTDSAETEVLNRLEKLERLRILANPDETDRRILLGFSLEGKTTRQLAEYSVRLLDRPLLVRNGRILYNAPRSFISRCILYVGKPYRESKAGRGAVYRDQRKGSGCVREASPGTG